MTDNQVKNNLNQENSNLQVNAQPRQSHVDITNFLQKANNPIVVFFTLIFKVCSGVM